MTASSKRGYFPLGLAAAFGLVPVLAMAQDQPQPLEGSAPPVVSSPVVAPGPAFFGGISVAKGGGELVKLPRPVANIFAADPSIVEVRPASPNTMFVFGKSMGETTIVTTDTAGNTIAQYSVSVRPSSFVSDRLRSQASKTAPGNSVTAEAEPGGVIVRGTVRTPEQAANVVEQAKLISPTGTVVNNLQVQEPIQVELKVRIASMSRNITRELGINWSAAAASGFNIGKFAVTGSTGSTAASLSTATQGGLNGVGVTFPGGNFEGVIDALATDNLAHILAEPTLTTLSGTQASFQVGGQFPIPVSSGNGVVTVSFKNYGVLLTFVPTVFSDGRISLQVAPQLSELNSANSASVGTGTSGQVFNVPSLNVTAASSTVILGSGQGMAIAGLLEDQSNQVDNGVPGLSEMPLVGALFRGDAFQRQQQEVVITVTPYLVNPVNNPGALASPDDGWTPPNDLQRILLLRDNGTNTASTTIPGDAGFIVQ
jgi:pilus assembly protein CpaC